MVEVTDADRAAAAGLKERHGTSYDADLIRQGRMDDGDYVQHFARHREQAVAEAHAWRDIASAPRDG